MKPALRAWLAGDVRTQLSTITPPTVPGYDEISRSLQGSKFSHAIGHPLLSLAYSKEDWGARAAALRIKAAFARDVAVRLEPVSSLNELLSISGPPPHADLILLGWSGEFFDAYNFLDQFPCSSALNIAQWCDTHFDALMHKAVRTLDAQRRYAIEQELEQRLTGVNGTFPAAPLSNPEAHVVLNPAVRGFEWSPVGFWDLRHVRRG